MNIVENILSAFIIFLGTLSLYWWVRLLRDRQAGMESLAFRERPRVTWPFPLVLILFLAGPTLVTMSIGAALNVPRSTDGLDLRTLQAICLSSLLAIILLPVALSRSGPWQWIDFGLDFSEWRTDLRAGGWGLLISLLPVYVMALAVSKLREGHPHKLLVFLSEHAGPTEMFWVGLTAVLMAPLLEEMLFRVMLESVLEDRIGPFLAILISSLTFCAAHEGWDMVPLFPLAVVLGYVYHRRRSYLAVVLLHGLFNAGNLVIALLTHEPGAVPAP